MLSRLRGTLLRDNRVLPVALAVLVVLVLAWVIFGLVLGGEDQQQVADQEIAAQSPNNGTEPAAPEVENRNVDSYAAYEAKDPFRQLIEPAEEPEAGGTTSEPAPDRGGGATTPGGGTTVEDGGRSPGGGGQRGQGLDSDGDGLSDRRENRLGLDPANPDTDGDGVRDGADDSNGDGRPDGGSGGRGGGQGGGNTGGGSGGRGGGLFDSGGSLFRGGK